MRCRLALVRPAFEVNEDIQARLDNPARGFDRLAVTDSDGRFAFPTASPGKCAIDNGDRVGGRTELTVAPGQEARVQIVTDAPSDQPPPLGSKGV